MVEISHYLISIVAVLIILTVHEYSHALVADRLGDPTAREMGRLTLNPLRHLDPIGALCMVLFHFGWARPVPIDLRYFKKPRRDFALSALAGPLSNLVCAFIGAFFYLGTYALFRDVVFTSEFSYNFTYYTLYFFLVFHQINLGIAIFNLLPIPPLDGSRLLGVILPERAYYAVLRYERVIYYAVLAWLFLGRIVSDFILSIPGAADIVLLRVLSEILSLSGLIGHAVSFLSEAMLDFWQLILAL